MAKEITLRSQFNQFAAVKYTNGDGWEVSVTIVLCLSMDTVVNASGQFDILTNIRLTALSSRSHRYCIIMVSVGSQHPEVYDCMEMVGDPLGLTQLQLHVVGRSSECASVGSAFDNILLNLICT